MQKHFSLTPNQGIWLDVQMCDTFVSDFQTIEVFDHAFLGRCMALDGHIQFATYDEHLYHEMLLSPAAMSLAQHNRALIVGGGDGLAARRLLDMGFASVAQVELDRAVTEMSQKWFAPQLGTALSDPRLECHFEDALHYIPKLPLESINLLALDLTDPTGDALNLDASEGLSDALFSRAFYEQCRARLAPGGVMSVQVGCPYLFPSHFKAQVALLSALFPRLMVYGQYLHCYGMHQFFIVASNTAPVEAPDTEHLDAQMLTTGKSLSYYSPRLHQEWARNSSFWISKT